MKEWFQQNNPDAYQSITARMLEAVRHGYWAPSEDVIESLATAYEESVAENGASCCHHTCGNPLLNEFVSGMVSVPGYVEQMEAATQVENQETTETQSSSHSSNGHQTSVAEKLNQTAKANSDSLESNQTAQDSDAGYGVDSPESAPDVRQSADSDYVEGYEMQKEDPVNEEENGGLSFSGSDIIGVLFVVVAVGGIYLGMRKKKI
jgi:cobaltochelatase CobN